MRRISLIISNLLLFVAIANAQASIEKILGEVERNNTTLVALRQKMEAEKIGSRTGLYPQNPSFEYSYQWGNPADIGSKTDISLIQSFDFPTAYLYRSKIAKAEIELLATEYLRQSKQLLLDVRLVCIELVYQNALSSVLGKRVSNAKLIADAYSKKLDVGEASALENNKARLTLLNATQELFSVKLKQNELLAKLASLNGGIPLELSDSVFNMPAIPASFDEWYAATEQSNPDLKAIEREIAVAQRNIQLSRALCLPQIKAGYASEKVAGEHFQGIAAGISIPLWENSKRVKYAKARAQYLRSVEADRKVEIFSRQQAQYNTALELQKNIAEYRNSMGTINSSRMLDEALQKGEISLVDYLLEESLYYSSAETLLQMERDFCRVVAELYQYQ
jgi:outer membrane protein TolC